MQTIEVERETEERELVASTSLITGEDVQESDIDPDFESGTGVNRETGMNLRSQLFALPKSEPACANELLKYINLPDISDFSLSKVYALLEADPRKPLEIKIPVSP